MRQLTGEKVTSKCTEIESSTNRHAIYTPLYTAMLNNRTFVNILFIILTHVKLKLKNTNVNNCILENIHIVLPLYHLTSTLMMAME